MFLFNKRTKKIIRYVWGVFAVLIIISMVVAYSGFTALNFTQQQPQAIPQDPNIAITSVEMGTSTVIVATSTPTVEGVKAGTLQLLENEKSGE